MESISYKELEKWILRNRKEVSNLHSHIRIFDLGISVYTKVRFKLFKGFVTTDASIRDRNNMDISRAFSKKERLDLLRLVTMVVDTNRLDDRRESIKRIKSLMK